MKELLKKTAMLAAIGFALGLLVGLGFLMYEGISAVLAENGPAWIAAYMLISGAMGLINMGTMTLYEIEHWSLTRSTLSHFAIMIVTFCGMGLFLDWFHSAMGWIMLAIFVVVYFIIWLVMYLSYRRRIRSLNEELKHWKEAQERE